MKKIIVILISLLLCLYGSTQSCLPEGITFSTQDQIDNFKLNYPNCNIIEGNVKICGNDITNLDSLIVITSINGSLLIGNGYLGDNPNLVSLKGLDSLESIGNMLWVYSSSALSGLNGLQGLNTIGGELKLSFNYFLTSIEGLSGLTSIGTNLTIQSNIDLISLVGLEGINSIAGDVVIGNTASTSLTGLEGLIEIGGDFQLIGNYELSNLAGLAELTSIGGDVWIYHNVSLANLQGLNNLTFIGGGLGIDENDNLDNLVGLEGLNTVGDLVIIDNEDLYSLTGLEGLTAIGGYLSIWSNQNLLSLIGLNNLNTINGDLYISYNHDLTSLTGLEALYSIDGWLSIEFNESLTSLSGIDNLNALSIDNIKIDNNNSLSNCEVQSLCNYLANPTGKVIIYYNSDGCNNPSEIANSCGFLLPCLPYGDYYFLSQSEIDNFQALYPGCTTLEGATDIHGQDINNLIGLSSVSSIGVSLELYNNDLLTSLTGLEGITYIGKGLFISSNLILTNLSGLDNFVTDSSFVLRIKYNSALSTCEIQSICDLLASPNVTIEINGNSQGCNSQQEVEAACGVGLKEEGIPQSLLNIYPNPSSTQITIEANTPINHGLLKIFNLNGQELNLYQITEPKMVIDISYFPAGVYFVGLTSENEVRMFKVVKY